MALDFNLLSTNNPADAANSAMKGMQQVNALTTQRLANQASSMDIQNALAEQEAWKKSATPQEAQKNLMRGGFGKSALAIGQSLATQAKTQAETKKTGAELTEKNMGIMRERTKDLLGNTSNENYIAHIQEGLRDGLITPEQAQRSVQTYIAIPPNQRVAYITQQLAKAEKIYETNTMTAGEKARLGQAESHFQIGQQGVAQTLTDSAGNVTLLDKQGNVMKQLGPVGKPSATFEKTAALQKQQSRDLSLAISELTNATKDGGLIDKSTGSGIGRLADVSAGFIGQATPGAIAIAKLKPIADIALKMVPRFEGPQSDKDTQSYKEAAGQLADPSLPTQTRKEAGKEVLRLMKARKGQFVNEVMANEGIGAGAGAPALPPGFTPDR